MMPPGYSSSAWRKVRLVVLARDAGVCQIRSAKCTITATEVDHVISPLDGGAWYDTDNLRAACGPCNSSRGGRLGRLRQTPAPPSPTPSRDWWPAS